MRVNRFMLDNQINLLIEERLKPVIASHIDMVKSVDQMLFAPFQNLTSRIEELELSMYGKNSKENRLETLIK